MSWLFPNEPKRKPSTSCSVAEKLLEMVRTAEVRKSDISKHSISEIEFYSNGHRLAVSWYSNGMFRYLRLDNVSAPVSNKMAHRILAAAQDRSNEIFEERARLVAEMDL